MVTDAEMQLQKFTNSKRLVSMPMVGPTEMSVFKVNNSLLCKMINDKVDKLSEEKNMSKTAVQDELEYECQISTSTIDKTISQGIRLTRGFLYKFCIGTKMTKSEAAEYFRLSPDGELSDNNMGDYIFLRALGEDSIFDFIDQYEKYTGYKISLRDRKYNDKNDG